MKIKTTKSLEENKEVNLYKLGLENFFCEYDLKSMTNLFLKDTLNFFKIYNVCALKATMEKVKHIEWKKVLC